MHIITESGEVSPSSFIPFCEFGGKRSKVGTFNTALWRKYDIQYVCNSFQAKIQDDQLCYEIDLDKFSDRDNIENELKTGFVFIMDYNEDRQTDGGGVWNVERI